MSEISVSMKKTDDAAHVGNLNNYIAARKQPQENPSKKWNCLLFR